MTKNPFNQSFHCQNSTRKGYFLSEFTQGFRHAYISFLKLPHNLFLEDAVIQTVSLPNETHVLHRYCFRPYGFRRRLGSHTAKALRRKGDVPYDSCTGGGLDGLEDFRVARAAAEISTDGCLHVLLCRGRIALQQRF